MKKILHIISQRPEKTGSGIYLQSILEEANKKGYKQSVIAGVPAQLDKVDLANINRENFYPVKFETEDLPFPVVGMSDVMPYKSSKYEALTSEMLSSYKKEFEQTITKAIKNFNPDLIITHHLWILTSLVNSLATDIKVIAISHGTGLRQLKKSNKFVEDVISGCKDIDLVFALNNYQKEEISKLYDIDREKIIVMGAGYNSKIFYRENKEENTDDIIKLVYAGKISYSKGVKSLIKACNKLDLKGKENIELILVGTGSGKEYKDIKRLVKESKMNIILRGSVEQRKLGDIFRESDIFCFASFYEGLPLVLIEAIASGLKVVTTDLPGVKEWLGEEINNSDIIEYVKLPRLQNTDIPIEDDLFEFEKSFKKAIEKQISKLDNTDYLKDNDLKRKVKSLSWSGVFERMEQYFI